MEPENLTLDAILGGRVRLYQPAQGYRVAIDPIFLSASILATEPDTVLDLGSGVGAASFCLAQRTGCRVVGLEVQRDMIRLAARNAELNGLSRQVEFLHGNLMTPPPRLAPSTFSHVMANPPYLSRQANTASPSLNKSTSNMLDHGPQDLKAWVQFACLMVRPQGTVTFVFPAESIDLLLHLLYGKVGHLKIFPLWISDSRSANRVIIRGIKGLQGPSQLCHGLNLHDSTGKFTQEADAVLRHGQALEF
jgi:tRNA1(Val) A37 N6-methylase TrmN6